MRSAKGDCGARVIAGGQRRRRARARGSLTRGCELRARTRARVGRRERLGDRGLALVRARARACAAPSSFSSANASHGCTLGVERASPARATPARAAASTTARSTAGRRARRAAAAARRARARRSVRQMLRPSTTPADSTASARQRGAPRRRAARGARTRSTCRPCTGSRAMRAACSASAAEVGREQQLAAALAGERGRRRCSKASQPARLEIQCTSAGSSSCTHSMPMRRAGAARMRAYAGTSAGSSCSRSKPGCVLFASHRKVSGPSSTGLTGRPSALRLARLRRSSASAPASKRVSGAELRHEVVVVGVEPLGHLQRRLLARCRARARSTAAA